MKRASFITLLVILFFFMQPAYPSEVFQMLSGNKDASLKKQMIDLARKSLEKYLADGSYLQIPNNIPAPMKKPSGVFVTITKKGKPRGCMGTLTPTQENLAKEIVLSSIKAATEDRRFSPVMSEEISELDFCISIPGELKRIKSLSEINPASNGLLVRYSGKSALLLPGEARTARWLYDECCRKAGIPQGKSVEMFVFSTITFGP